MFLILAAQLSLQRQAFALVNLLLVQGNLCQPVKVFSLQRRLALQLLGITSRLHLPGAYRAAGHQQDDQQREPE
ncbi:hypothetical protein PFUM301598_43930 [Pseudomonas fluorescens]